MSRVTPVVWSCTTGLSSAARVPITIVNKIDYRRSRRHRRVSTGSERFPGRRHVRDQLGRVLALVVGGAQTDRGAGPTAAAALCCFRPWRRGATRSGRRRRRPRQLSQRGDPATAAPRFLRRAVGRVAVADAGEPGGGERAGRHRDVRSEAGGGGGEGEAAGAPACFRAAVLTGGACLPV
jgi:hypothetical protein